jgi:hypothetical protein
VPILNFLIQILLWIWLAKDTLIYDSASIIFNKFSKKDLSKYYKAIWLISSVGSLYNFVPFINIFGPFFSEIAMFNYLMQKRNEIKNENE